MWNELLNLNASSSETSTGSTEDLSAEDGPLEEIFWAGAVGTLPVAAAVARRCQSEAGRLARSVAGWEQVPVRTRGRDFNIQSKPVAARDGGTVYRAVMEAGLAASTFFAYLCSPEGYLLIDPDNEDALIADINECFTGDKNSYEHGFDQLQLEYAKPLDVGWPYQPRTVLALTSRDRRRRLITVKKVLGENLVPSLEREMDPTEETVPMETTFILQVKSTGHASCSITVARHLDLGGNVPYFFSDLKCKELLLALLNRLDKYIYFEVRKRRLKGVYTIVEEEEEEEQPPDISNGTGIGNPSRQHMHSFEDDSDDDPEELFEFCIMQAEVKKAHPSLEPTIVVRNMPNTGQAGDEEKQKPKRRNSKRWNVVREKKHLILSMKNKSQHPKKHLHKSRSCSKLQTFDDYSEESFPDAETQSESNLDLASYPRDRRRSNSISHSRRVKGGSLKSPGEMLLKPLEQTSKIDFRSSESGSGEFKLEEESLTDQHQSSMCDQMDISRSTRSSTWDENEKADRFSFSGCNTSSSNWKDTRDFFLSYDIPT